MNKRARLARRILRDHRRKDGWHSFHMSLVDRRDMPMWQVWHCTHCPRQIVDQWVPHAYR